jgi:signal transduction histidine kinase
MEPIIRCRNVSKQFGTLPVVQDVSFDLRAGEVVGLTGLSGAGKSVLVRMFAGLELPNAGEISLADTPVVSSGQAHALGIAVIHQHPALVEHLDVTETIFLGHEVGGLRRLFWLNTPNQRAMDNSASRILAQLGVSVPSLRERVGNLSGEHRQMLAIAQVLARSPRLVVVDEPTTLLRYEYQQTLLELIRTWQSQGVAVLFSSQNLDHLFAVTDRILVLRHGRLVLAVATDATNRESVVSAQIGASDQQHLTPMIWALENYHRAREQAETLRQQRRVLEHDLAAQDTLNRQLIAQLADQVTSLDRANTALQAAQRRLLSEREQERKALARELHDQVIQDLVSLNYAIDELRADLVAPDPSHDTIIELRDTIRGLVTAVRDICGVLRPPTIDSLGVGAAIQSFSREWSSRSGIAVTIEIEETLGRLPDAIEISIFRMIQEGLSNVRKHAQASAVHISLRSTSQRSLLLTIADNGRGLSRDTNLAALAAAGHYGLLGISERVALVKGRFRLHEQARGGVMLEVEIPHARVDDEEAELYGEQR